MLSTPETLAVRPLRLVLAAIVAPSVLPLTYMILALLFSGYPFGAPGHPEKFFLGVASTA